MSLGRVNGHQPHHVDVAGRNRGLPELLFLALYFEAADVVQERELRVAALGALKTNAALFSGRAGR